MEFVRVNRVPVGNAVLKAGFDPREYNYDHLHDDGAWFKTKAWSRVFEGFDAKKRAIRERKTSIGSAAPDPAPVIRSFDVDDDSSETDYSSSSSDLNEDGSGDSFVVFSNGTSGQVAAGDKRGADAVESGPSTPKRQRIGGFDYGQYSPWKTNLVDMVALHRDAALGMYHAAASFRNAFQTLANASKEFQEAARKGAQAAELQMRLVMDSEKSAISQLMDMLLFDPTKAGKKSQQAIIFRRSSTQHGQQLGLTDKTRRWQNAEKESSCSRML